jgi:hypothetical protein
MSEKGHSRPGRIGSKSAHVRYCAESGSKFRHCHGPLRVDGAARDVIQAAKPEPRIMRYEVRDYGWTAIKPMLPTSRAAFGG